MKCQDISVDIKTLSPGGCLPLPRGYNHEKKNGIKSDFKEVFFKLAPNDWSDKNNVPADIKILSPRGCQPLPWDYIHL